VEILIINYIIPWDVWEDPTEDKVKLWRKEIFDKEEKKKKKKEEEKEERAAIKELELYEKLKIKYEKINNKNK